MIEADPLEDIANLRKIKTVIKEGSVIDREALPTVEVLDYDPDALRQTLIQERDYGSVNIRTLTSGLSVIEVGDGVLIGGADKRRDGTVGGR